MISGLGELVGGGHYLAFLLIVIISCILLSRTILSERVNQGSFWITLLVCASLIVVDILEKYAQMDPARRDLRLISSVAGYALRPAAVLGFLLVIWPAGRPCWFLWIPVAVNGILYSTAFSVPLVFSFDSDYSFQRGPLGSAVFFVCILYLVLIMITIHRRFKDRRAGDLFVIYLCALGCLGAMAVDMLLGEITLISAILISGLVFYLFLRGQDMDHDALTRLWNRSVFYEDCRKNRNAVTAVASVDMNGLKRTNDELGHDAGDRALRMIGHALHGITGRKTAAYRIGGDEFMILFLHSTEEETRQALTAFTDEIWRVGLSVAIGLSTAEECGGNLDEMIRLSDQRMYEDKSRYYQAHDRRRQR